MRKFLVILAVSLAASAFAQQQDFSKVQMKVIKITDHVYMLQGAGGNIGVSVGDDGIVIVDDEFAPLVPKIREALKAITTKPVKYIINTHYHGDHTGGNAAFSKDGPIIAHDNARKRLESGTKNAFGTTPPAPKDALPIVTFNDRATLHVNGEDIRITHLPHGHTDGDVMVEFTKSNVVHLGDDYTLGRFPFVDLENGGSIKGMIANLDKVYPTLDKGVRIIPGHGSLGDKPALNEFMNMLKGTVAIMNEAIQRGESLDEVKKNRTLVAWNNWTENGGLTLEQYEEQLYRELKGDAATASSPTK
jgi:glyoxylase-like metal-dependent hydrolase (beta-lactamase superfamily II)